MITPNSNLNVIDKIRYFSIDLSSDEIEKINTLLEPINDLLNAHENNSINVFKEGQDFHVESLIRLNNCFSRSQAYGSNLRETIKSLIPEVIKKASTCGDYNLKMSA